MRVLVVDDEAAARRRLAELLDELGAEIVGEAADGEAALDLAASRRPEIIFLDVAMPEVDGFDVARHLAEPRPLVVFQTAYPERALEAFDHEALDYIVKPVTRDRLTRVLERAARRLASATAGAWSGADLDRLGTALGHRPATPARILVRHGAGHRLVRLRDISRFSADGGLVYAHVTGAVSGTDYTLNELEARTGGSFVRVSRADLVSIAHVTDIAGGGDGSARLTLADGTSIRVSRRRAAGVRSGLGR